MTADNKERNRIIVLKCSLKRWDQIIIPFPALNLSYGDKSKNVIRII